MTESAIVQFENTRDQAAFASRLANCAALSHVSVTVDEILPNVVLQGLREGDMTHLFEIIGPGRFHEDFRAG